MAIILLNMKRMLLELYIYSDEKESENGSNLLLKNNLFFSQKLLLVDFSEDCILV